MGRNGAVVRAAGGAVGVVLAGAALVAPGCGDGSAGGSTNSSSAATAPSSERYGGVPRGAERGAAGRGKVQYTAPHAGVVWVGNESKRFVVTKHAVKRGDKVEVMPDRDLVEVNDQAVFQQNLERNDEHAVYFLEEGSSGGSGSGPSAYGGVPEDAWSAAHGVGHLSWRADSAGEVWVGDDKQRRVLVNRRVNSGDYIEIDIKHDQIKVNGSAVYSQNLESKHTHSIFFRSGGGGGHSGGGAQRPKR